MEMSQRLSKIANILLILKKVLGLVALAFPPTFEYFDHRFLTKSKQIDTIKKRRGQGIVRAASLVETASKLGWSFLINHQICFAF